MSTRPETIADSHVAIASSELEIEALARTRTLPGARPTKIIHPPAFSLTTIFAGLTALVQYSDLFYTLSLFRLNVRYKQSVLGWAWAVLQPLALMTIYTVIFSRITKVATGGIPYPVFVLSGLLPWIFFSSTVSNAVNGLVLHPNLLTKMYFPREIVPLSYLLASGVDFCIASVLLGGLITYYKIPLGRNLIYAIPIMIVMACFAAAIALFFSTIQVRFRDMGLAIPFLLQIWMFTVPVVYSLQSVPTKFRSWYLLDPAAGLIDAFRSLILRNAIPDLYTLALNGGITLVALTLAYAFFKSSEATMADNI